MSNPIQSLPTPTGEYQSHFGGPPGSPDAAAECKKWETICGELLAERQKLRTELAKVETERDSFRKTVLHFMSKECPPPTFTKEEVFAALKNQQPLDEMIADLQKLYAREESTCHSQLPNSQTSNTRLRLS